MITSISIQNYALIKDLQIDFSQGLNVITGETGAGKSIIIDALSLLLGQRADRQNIRKDERKMTVSALFQIDDLPDIQSVLESFGIQTDGTVTLTREVDRNGRNVCRANGTIVPLKLFKDLSLHLINIHSQHENVALFRPEAQRDLLDQFAGEETLQIKDQIKDLTSQLKERAQTIRELQRTGKEATRAYSVNKFQRDEIEKAALEENEDEELEENLTQLQKGEDLFFQTGELLNYLSSDDPDTPSILDQLGSLQSILTALAGREDFFVNYSNQLEDIISQMNTLSFDVTTFVNNLDYDPQKLRAIQDRLGMIDELKKKYGDTISEILTYKDELEKEIDTYENQDDLLSQAKEEYTKLRKDYNNQAKLLTEKRLQAGERLKQVLENELKDLAMDKARVEIAVNTDTDVISANGQDSVAFLLSVNPGIEPMELKKVASGGEISRVMLALKSIFGDKEQIGTMIFDEIDTGISGRTAQVVAEKIEGLSRSRQVVCITHLPQIAAMADSQFLVTKLSDLDETEVTFDELDSSTRVEELARMLSGAETTDVTIQSAQQMIEQAEELKAAV